MWNIMCGSKIMASMCTYENVLCILGRERGGVSVEVLDLYTLSRKYIMGSTEATILVITCHNNSNECRTLGATRARILKSARATEMRVTESIRKICEQKTETKGKGARCLTLSRIPGSV